MPSLDRYEQMLEKAKATITEQNELLERLTSLPLMVATIVRVTKKELTVVTNNGTAVIKRPPGKELGQFRIGDQVKLNSETMQVIASVKTIKTGRIANISRLIDNRMVEVEVDGSSHTVLASDAVLDRLEEGRQVIVDRSLSVILEILESTGAHRRFEWDGNPNVSWDEIGGLEDAKSALREAVELPHRAPELHTYYNRRLVKGVELHGPPGCGKTLLVKAFVTSMREIYGSSGGFFYVKGPELLHHLVGVTENGIRMLFDAGRRNFAESGAPSVLFMDEAESLLPVRGSGISSDIEKTIVPMFLAEMDGLDDSSMIVIMATNRADRLDPAVVRPGRVDRRIHVGRPNMDDCTRIFDIHFGRVPVQSRLSDFAALRMFSDDLLMARVLLKESDPACFTLGHVISGAMIESVVQQSAGFALLRDLENSTQTGIAEPDVEKAIRQVYRESLSQNFEDDFYDFLMGVDGDEVIGMQRVKPNGDVRTQKTVQ